jgi:transcription-repair coupling factor (superfamily II helicase)
MSEAAMMRIMEDFRSHAIDILLATTIIENGLDISSANTLIVDDATRLGLAQAHQLRGRIGRGETQAFAYFLYRPRRLTEKGARRLDALKEYAELGAGYDIALRDLEIRGAGNVFGREQSGAINKVGLNLYCQMIADAVDDLPV